MMGMWVQFNSVLNSGLVKLPQGQPSTSGSFGQDKARHGLPLLLCVQQLHSVPSSVDHFIVIVDNIDNKRNHSYQHKNTEVV